MSQYRVARRYALALIEYAEAEKIFDEVTSDVGMLRTLIETSRELQRFLTTPIIKRDKKREIVESLFRAKVNPATMNFLLLLLEKGRENVLLEIIKQYFALNDERKGIMTVEVKSTDKLDEQQKEKLRIALNQLTGKKIRLDVGIDKTILGGVVARAGDTIYDGSINHQLEAMRRKLIAE
jgi:F-type H+-transporting ATPase subunit delta